MNPSTPHRAYWLPRPTLIELGCLLTGLVLVLRYAWLMDDAFVYFRYVDNFAILNLGLVYNAGEFVEGYSSPLWASLLAVLRWCGADLWHLICTLGLLSFALFWYLMLVLDRHLAPSSPRINFSLIACSLNYGILCYFTSGLESPLVSVIAAVFALAVVSPHTGALQVALGAAPLIRQELVVPLGLYLLWRWKSERRFPLKLTLYSLLFGGGWLLFRIWYYADLFPNTFYLKNTVDIAQGFRYLYDSAVVYHWDVWLALSALALICVRFFKKRASAPLFIPERTVMLLLALPVLLYVIKIGGDPRHFRYLAFPYVLTICATAGAFEHALTNLSHAPRLFGGVIASLVALGMWWSYPRQLVEHPISLSRIEYRIDKINDAAAHRKQHDLKPAEWRIPPSQMREVLSSGGTIIYRQIKDLWWCADAYRAYDSYVIHSLGLTDALLGRSEVPVNRPAHRLGLKQLARDMKKIARSSPTVGPGMYRAAVAAGQAPPWIAHNIEQIELIERKIYNRHAFMENLRLALTFPAKLTP